MRSLSIAEVVHRLEQLHEELLATFRGRERFSGEGEFVGAGEDLHRRLGLCIKELKERLKNG